MTVERRQPGQVRDAILAALRGKPSGLGLNDIRAAVGAKLGDVPSSSVRSYLNLATKRGELERTGRAHYKIRRGR